MKNFVISNPYGKSANLTYTTTAIFCPFCRASGENEDVVKMVGGEDFVLGPHFLCLNCETAFHCPEERDVANKKDATFAPEIKALKESLKK